MNPYEKLVNSMREQPETGPLFKLATMTGARACKRDDGFLLSGEDLYIPDRLLGPVCTGVNVPSSHADKSTYSGALKAGDLVVISQIDSTHYVILERVVQG